MALHIFVEEQLRNISPIRAEIPAFIPNEILEDSSYAQIGA